MAAISSLAILASSGLVAGGATTSIGGLASVSTWTYPSQRSIMVKRRSRSTSTGIPDMRFFDASPGGATASRRSRYFRGRMCGKTSIFMAASRPSPRGARLPGEGPCPVPAVAVHGIVPEELPARRLGDRGPAQDDLHRLGGPALRMRVVGREHQGVLAEGLQRVAQRLLALVDLDALEVL